MESILARALEYTLKYWLKSFTRDQFKLQGRTVQLSNLDINGDAVHASLGLPPALNVTTAKVGKLEIMLPSVSNVQIEPIVVQIDKLDLVLEENDNLDASRSNNSTQTSTNSTKGTGYGFADKIADGMTLQVHTVNLLLETHGGALQRGGSTWASPMASITIRNLLLYTTNESWQVVNLKEARDFSNGQNFIYVFKILEWESLSVDLLPHPDMFADAHFTLSGEGSNRKDEDGAKRVFFGGERFIEGISGEAYITIQRTELNCPLGLEVQLHITEAVCPALSEPGLRAVLRFFTGLYVCLNRGDVNPYAQQHASEVAGRSLVSIVVDHIFLCVKDAEYQLELLMQSLFFCRASVSDGTNAKYLTRVMIGGLFLRDTFSRPFCTLVQPPMQTTCDEFLHIPDFGKNFCPPIYPLGEQRWQSMENVPLICIHSLQFIPTPAPPSFASQTVIDCQPLMIHLQEESCQRIFSFLSDGIVVNPGTVLPDSSVNSLVFNMKGLDITVPLEIGETSSPDGCDNSIFKNSFSGARLHIENLFFSESPSLKLGLLNLEKDPACFCLWEGQPIDASQNKWTVEASLLSLSLETCNESNGFKHFLFKSQGLLTCVELREACVEVAMVTADGSPLINVPPPGGIVRVGVACQQYISNTSVEQLFFVLDLYSYFGTISEKITIVRKNSCPKKTRIESLGGTLMEKVPGDTAVSFAVKDLQLRFLESVSMDVEEMPLVQFVGKDLSVKVSHRTLGGAIAISSSLCWDSVEVDCAETEINLVHKSCLVRTPTENGHSDVRGYPQLRAVLWVQNRGNNQLNGSATSAPFLDLSMIHVIPYDVRDRECHSINISACVAGVCLGGGMNYVEALLHRFGILGPDGGPGKGFSKGIEHLSVGPLSKLFKASSLNVDQLKESVDNGGLQEDRDSVFLEFGTPDDVEVVIELRDWFFALEGAQETSERRWFSNFEGYSREERCWHSTFQCLQLKAKSGKHLVNGHGKLHKTRICPIELVTVGVEGLQALKPLAKRVIQQDGSPVKGIKQSVQKYSGIDLKVDIVISEDPATEGTVKWVMENFKFSVKQPIEAVVSKDELQYLAFLCKSEVDSMGRITAGFLRVLKLEGSVGHAAINQLSNLGSEGFGKIFTSANSGGSIGRIANSYVTGESLHPSLESTVAALEEAILDSQSRCAALTVELGDSESSIQHLDTAKHLGQKLETMQRLLMQLRTQI